MMHTMFIALTAISAALSLILFVRKNNVAGLISAAATFVGVAGIILVNNVPAILAAIA